MARKKQEDAEQNKVKAAPKKKAASKATAKKSASKTVKDKPKNKGGRPSSYNKEIADYICLKIGTSVQGIKRLCKSDPKMPDDTTIFEWRYKNPEFARQYAEAKRKQAELLAEYTLDIAEDGRNDFMENEDPNNPGYKVNGEYYQRSRLRIDTLKWHASKLLPKVYGDHKQLEALQEDNSQLREELLRLRKELDKKSKKDY